VLGIEEKLGLDQLMKMITNQEKSNKLQIRVKEEGGIVKLRRQ